MSDMYETLGVARDASTDDIKKAYRKLAMKYHPDRNPDDQNAARLFKEAKDAYDVLSDPEKRKAYDRYGRADVPPGGFGGFGGFGAAGPEMERVFGDIFGDIFGGGAGAQWSGGGPQWGARQSGGDLETRIEITLAEAAAGLERAVAYQAPTRCETCGGDGAKPGVGASECKTCDGSGQLRMQRGFFSVQQTCPQCGGAGRVVAEHCPDCDGQGRVVRRRRLSVKIPAGIEDGMRIRLRGEGEAGIAGGAAGDLFVRVHVKPHNMFHREGADLFLEMPLSFTTAALGGELEVPTLGGRVTLKIPAGTQSGKQFRLRDKGVRQLNNDDFGDLFVRVQVETPVHLSEEQKDLLRQFAGTVKAKHHPQEGKWIKRAKDFLQNLGVF